MFTLNGWKKKLAEDERERGGRKLTLELLNWFSGLSVEQRQLILTETSPDFTKFLTTMTMQHQATKDKPIFHWKRENGCLKPFSFSHFMKYFIAPGDNCYIYHVDELKDKSDHYERLIFSGVRLCSLDLFHDSITVKQRLVADLDSFIACLFFFSNRKCFEITSDDFNEYKKQKRMQKGVWIINFARWMLRLESGTIFMYISAFLEEIMIVKFFDYLDCLSLEPLIAPYMPFFSKYRQIIEYWTKTSNKERECVADTYFKKEAFAKESSQKSLKTIASQLEVEVYQRKPLIKIEILKEFLCYAVTYANPYLMIDMLFFCPLSFIDETIGIMLDELKELFFSNYSSYIMKSLLEDYSEENTQKKKAYKKKNMWKNGKKIEEEKERIIEEKHYDIDKIKENEYYYRSFFEFSNIEDKLTVSLIESKKDIEQIPEKSEEPLPAPKKAKKKRRRNKKKIPIIEIPVTEKTLETVLIVDDPVEEPDSRREPIQKDSILDTQEIQQQSNVERNIDEQLSSESFTKNKKVKNKINKKKTLPIQVDKEAVKEYLELKANAVEMFAKSIGVNPSFGNRKKKAKKGSKKPEINQLENTNEIVEPENSPISTGIVRI